MRFEIGQEVWWASFESEVAYVTCPDCGGTRHIRCILFDGTEVTVDCEGCRRGYEGSQGRLQVYSRQPRAVRDYVKGFEFRGERAEWQLSATYGADDEDVFLDEASALARARDKAAALDLAERERIQKKEKDARSWSWHVHYHRKAIRDAEKQIEYHSAKLAVARAKSTEPEPV